MRSDSTRNRSLRQLSVESHAVNLYARSDVDPKAVINNYAQQVLGRTVIRAEDAAETISPFDKIHGRIGNFAIDQPVAQPLMISFQVIVFGVLFDCQSKSTPNRAHRGRTGIARASTASCVMSC